MRYFHNAVLAQSASTGGGPGPGGGARVWFDDGVPAYVEPTPTGSGVTRNIANYSQWVTAKAAAGPGDVLRITAPITGMNEPDNSTLRYDGRNGDTAGTAANPIIITCAPGAYIQSVYNVGSPTFPEALLIIGTQHVHVIGCDLRNGQFGLRFMASQGSAANPIKAWHNTISGVRDANIQIGDGGGQGWSAPSAYISVKYNTVSNSVGSVEFNEGVYIGTGSTSYYWQDRSHDIEVAYNDISGTRGDGVDIKLGTYNINVHHNKIHDFGGELGSGVTSGATTSAPGGNPYPGDPGIRIHNNWIWNFGFAFSSTSPVSHGIIANLGGTEVYNNVIWNPDTSNDVNGIRTPFYISDNAIAVKVFNNTVWVSGTSYVTFNGGGSGAFVQYSNNLSADGAQGSQTVTAPNFVGPIPPIGASSTHPNATANAGDGPGSAFVPLAGATNIVGQATSGDIPATDITEITRPTGGASERGAYELE